MRILLGDLSREQFLNAMLLLAEIADKTENPLPFHVTTATHPDKVRTSDGIYWMSDVAQDAQQWVEDNGWLPTLERIIGNITDPAYADTLWRKLQPLTYGQVYKIEPNTTAAGDPYEHVRIMAETDEGDTIATYWVIDAIPCEEDGTALDGFNYGIPVHTSCLIELVGGAE
ncbi:MAG: hypothetical protein BWK73_20025 [Thiothrix lacustris]|uniref:Uncharacterized protein n=1 Tax=Thiothrix lacustris TaxID=525917 RepID=A0A1Y1QP35_9GAMM|nr:MAG: hypothetical protein BWK73_20025 [Thiothrix lacustris]